MLAGSLQGIGVVAREIADLVEISSIGDRRKPNAVLMKLVCNVAAKTDSQVTLC